MTDHWRTYWEGQQKPLHRRDEDDFYRLHGAELALLTGATAGRSVLEIGCGDGALYQPLGFDRALRYVGIDLSRSMLDAFRARGHSVDLRLGDAIDLPVDETFDVAFSNGVGQYLDLRSFARHLEAVARRLAGGGRYVCGSLPARERRASYAGGYGVYPPNRNLVRAAKERLLILAGRSSLGQWFGLDDVLSLATRTGYTAEVYGSLCYLYRYHVVFTKS